MTDQNGSAEIESSFDKHSESASTECKSFLMFLFQIILKWVRKCGCVLKEKLFQSVSTYASCSISFLTSPNFPSRQYFNTFLSSELHDCPFPHPASIRHIDPSHITFATCEVYRLLSCFRFIGKSINNSGFALFLLKNVLFIYLSLARDQSSFPCSKPTKSGIPHLVPQWKNNKNTAQRRPRTNEKT